MRNVNKDGTSISACSKRQNQLQFTAPNQPTALAASLIPADDESWDDVEFPASGLLSTDLSLSFSSNTDTDPLSWMQNEQDISTVFTSSFSLYDSDSSRLDLSLGGARSDSGTPASSVSLDGDGGKRSEDIFTDFLDEDSNIDEDMFDTKKITGKIIRLGGHRKVLDVAGDWEEDVEIPEGGLSLKVFRTRAVEDGKGNGRGDRFQLEDWETDFNQSAVFKGVDTSVTSMERKPMTTDKVLDIKVAVPSEPWELKFETLDKGFGVSGDVDVPKLSSCSRSYELAGQSIDWGSDIGNLSTDFRNFFAQSNSRQTSPSSPNSFLESRNNEKRLDDIVLPDSIEAPTHTAEADPDSQRPPPATSILSWQESDDDEDFSSAFAMSKDAGFLAARARNRNVKRIPQPLAPPRQLRREILPLQVYFSPSPSRIPRLSTMSSSTTTSERGPIPSRTKSTAHLKLHSLSPPPPFPPKPSNSVSQGRPRLSNLTFSPPTSNLPTVPTHPPPPFAKRLAKHASSPSLRSNELPPKPPAAKIPSSPLRRTILSTAASTLNPSLGLPVRAASTELRTNLLAKRASSSSLRPAPTPSIANPQPHRDQPVLPPAQRFRTWTGSISGQRTAHGAPVMLKKPKRIGRCGDGTELDGFDDLPTSAVVEERFRKEPVGVRVGKGREEIGVRKGWESGESRESGNEIRDDHKFRPRAASSSNSTSSRELSRKQTTATQEQQAQQQTTKPKKRQPTLIQQLGMPTAKVIGDMTYDPFHHRWDGNESALGDFNHVGGVVGDMVFDTKRMQWVGGVGKEEDPFAGIDEDEEKTTQTTRPKSRTVSDAAVVGEFAISNEFDPAVEVVEEWLSAESRHREEIGRWIGAVRVENEDRFGVGRHLYQIREVG